MLEQKTTPWDDNPGDTLTYVQKYIGLGFAPVPVEFRGKACTIKEWQKLRVRDKGIAELFQAPCNVGVILGETSGGLVDIDLDCEEAIILAPRMLPPTGMIFGRESSPRSHWIYKASDAGKGISLSDPDGNGMLVELRANGRMTVFPGSVHESGEKIRFNQNDKPAEVQFDELGSYARQLAAASLLLRHWKQGNRHNLALALSGALLRGKISEENASHLLARLIHCGAGW
jgi:hypothetical protein